MSRSDRGRWPYRVIHCSAFDLELEDVLNKATRAEFDVVSVVVDPNPPGLARFLVVLRDRLDEATRDAKEAHHG